MKIKGLQGYLLSLYYITEYEKNNILTDELKEIKFILAKESLYMCKRNKLSVETECGKAMDYFVNRYGSDKYSVSLLTMTLQLITRNPMRDKFKRLTSIGMKLNREHMLSKDEDIVNARKAVIGFYTEDLKKRKE